MKREDWGLKHRCLHCRSLFYDLGRSDIVCPRCGQPHNIEDAIKLKPFSAEHNTDDKSDDDTDTKESVFGDDSGSETLPESAEELDTDSEPAVTGNRNNITADTEES